MALEILAIRGDKKLWDKWTKKLKKEKVKVWDRIEPVIRKDLDK